MKNLILSTACGLDPVQIEFFIKSLREYYKGEVCFLVQNDDDKVKKLLRDHECNTVVINAHKFDVQVKRYSFYLEFLKKKKYDNILVCDSRDIYFQSNPFNYDFKGSINFFLESKKIKDCPFNTNWLVKTYGKKVYENLAENTINCSGTTLGNYTGMIDYLKLIIEQSVKYKFKKRLKYFLTFRRDKLGRGADQAYANFIAHNKLIKDTYLYFNESGPIATVYYLKKLIFNSDLQLINSEKKPYSIVHQYDKRWNEFEETVNKIKFNLGIKTN